MSVETFAEVVRAITINDFAEAQASARRAVRAGDWLKGKGWKELSVKLCVRFWPSSNLAVGRSPFVRVLCGSYWLGSLSVR